MSLISPAPDLITHCHTLLLITSCWCEQSHKKRRTDYLFSLLFWSIRQRLKTKIHQQLWLLLLLLLQKPMEAESLSKPGAAAAVPGVSPEQTHDRTELWDKGKISSRAVKRQTAQSHIQPRMFQQSQFSSFRLSRCSQWWAIIWRPHAVKLWQSEDTLRGDEEDPPPLFYKSWSYTLSQLLRLSQLNRLLSVFKVLTSEHLKWLNLSTRWGKIGKRLDWDKLEVSLTHTDTCCVIHH